MKTRSLKTALAACASVALLAGCSGSHSAPSSSTAQIAAKLSQESEFASVKTSVDKAKFDSLMTCIADYLHSKGRGSDVDAYVKGTKKLDDVKGFDSEKNAEKVGKDCVVKAGIPTS